MNAITSKNQGTERKAEGSQLLQSGDGSLMLKKLRQLFPVMLLNYISIMVMSTVDGVVVGWAIGEKAVASVSYFQPFNFVMMALGILISSGVATLMSKQLGTNDPQGMAQAKKAVLLATLGLALVLSVIQIPICLTMFRLYPMDPAVHDMALRYAYAVMVSTPFSIMNTAASYLLTSSGRAKTLLTASVIQSVVNVVLDVVLVFWLGMSTDGVGLGTMIATVAYWLYVTHHLWRHSEFLRIDWSVDCRQETLDIFRYGTPSLLSSMADAIFSTFIFWLIAKTLSDTGIAIHSVCQFAFSLILLFNLSMRGSMQSLTGMLSTIGDRVGMHRLLKRAMILDLILSGSVTLVAELAPALFFIAYGFQEIPAMGLAALRAYALQFPLVGLNVLLRLYFNNWDEIRFASVHGTLDCVILPAVFAGILYLFAEPWALWLCYELTRAVCFTIAWAHYLRRYRREEGKALPNEFNMITHPNEAPEAAAQLERILLENGISDSLANRIALCVEEIGAYALPARENAQVTIQIYASVYEGETTIVMLDDGQCVAFPEENRENTLVTSNYEVLRRITSECAYDYVLDLNRFTMKLRSGTSKKEA